MNKFLSLTKVLLKSGTGFQKSGNRKKNLSLLLIIVALLPMMISTTALFMNAYDTLKAVNLEGIILASLLSATCIAMILFGILYVISTYYFSDDIVQLITMPIKPHLILASKFVVVNIYQYFLEALFLLPCIIAFGIKAGSPTYWIYSIIVFLVLPVIPTVICSVISILLMSFGKVFKNKDRFKLISGILVLAIAIGINLAFRMGGSKLASSGSMIMNNRDGIKKAAMLFPSNLIAVNSILNESALLGLLQLVLFLLISAAAASLFLLLGNKLYISGVVGLTQSTVSGKRLSDKQFEKCNKKHSNVLALALKDWKILYRTPAYFLNCVLGGIVFPPLLLVLLGFSLKNSLLPKLNNPLMISIDVLIVSFLCIMNMASPTAISRDGKDAYVSKFIPVPYHLQVLAKLLPGLILSFFTLIMTLLISFFFIKVEPFAFISIFGLSFIALATFNMFGLFIDIAFPKLDWDDETVAVKRNLNVFIQLIVMPVVLALISFLINFTKPGLYIGVALLFIVHLLLFIVSAALLFKKGTQIYSGTTKAEANVKSIKGHKNLRKIITGVVTATAVIVFAVFIIQELTISPNVQISSSKVEISAGFMESSSFDIAQIKSVSIKNSIPKASKIVGMGAGNKRRGTFNVEGLGKGYVYTETADGPFLYVIMKDNSFTIFNFSDSAKTNDLYEKLKK